MQIIWDVVEKSITIIHGDRVFGLAGRFPTRDDGLRAARTFCRERGWTVKEAEIALM